MLELNATRSTLDTLKRQFNTMNEAFQNEVIFTDTLNDFFSTARIVTLHMQKQYSGEKGFGEIVDKDTNKRDGWYGSKQDEMKEVNYLRFLIKARDYREKEGPIPTGATRIHSVSAGMLLVKEGSKAETLESEIIEASPTLEPPEPKTLDRWFWDVGRYLDKGDKVLVPECEKKDVMETCKSIVEYLDKLVDECEAKFG